MILNVYTVIAAFLAGVAGLTAVCLIALSVRAWLALRSASNAGGGRSLEERVHLIALLLATVGIIRLVAWPHFYLMIQSYVDPLAVFGVMCSFGVTRVQPELVLALQILKPIVLLAIGFWWLVSHIDQQTTTGALLRVRAFLAIVAGMLVLGECSTELVYLFSQKVGQRVTCCTQFLETSAANIGAGAGPFRLVGLNDTTTTIILFLLLQVVVIAMALWMRKRIDRGAGTPSIISPIVLLFLSMASLWITRWVWIDLVAPRVLELPYHHCLYELVTDIPAFSLAAVLAVVGHGCLCWPVALEFFRGRQPDSVRSVQAGIFGFCAVAIASELLIVAVHLI